MAAIPTIHLNALKVDAPVSPDALPMIPLPPEGQPAGRPVVDLVLEGSDLTLRCELNGKSVRKAMRTLAENGTARVFCRLQGSIRPPAAPGEPLRLADAGLTVTLPTTPAPDGEKPAPPTGSAPATGVGPGPSSPAPSTPASGRPPTPVAVAAVAPVAGGLVPSREEGADPGGAPAGPPTPPAPAHGLARPDGISCRTWKNMKHKANRRAREAGAAPASGVPSTPMAGAVARSTIAARVKAALAPAEIGSPTSDLLAGSSQSPAVEMIPAGPENDPSPATATDALRRRYRAVTRELRSSLTADWKASLAQALARVEDAVASDDAPERLAAELALSNRLDAVMTIGMRGALSATAQAAQDDASRAIRLRTALASRAASRRPQAAASPVAG